MKKKGMKVNLQRIILVLIFYLCLFLLVNHFINALKQCKNEQNESMQVRPENLPSSYLLLYPQRQSGCVNSPHVTNINFNNLIWQVMETERETFYLYGAYLDNRPAYKDGPAIRVLTMINKKKTSIELFCQIWFEKGAVTVKIEEVISWHWLFLVR